MWHVRCKPVGPMRVTLRIDLFLCALTTCALSVAAERLAQAQAPEGAGGGGTIAGQVNAPNPKMKAGVVVSLEKVAGSFRPPAQPVEMDQRSMKFEPHVLAIMRGTTVRFKNSDAVSHNVFTPDGEKYNLGSWGKGDSKTYTFTKTGVYRQLCNIHPEMSAFIVVVENPFFAVTGDDGAFKIENVPPGQYAVRAWSEKLPAATANVTLKAGETANTKIDLKR
jgi:plastocyanin